MLFVPARHEALIDEPWSEEIAEQTIHEIVVAAIAGLLAGSTEFRF